MLNNLYKLIYLLSFVICLLMGFFALVVFHGPHGDSSAWQGWILPAIPVVMLMEALLMRRKMQAALKENYPLLLMTSGIMYVLPSVWLAYEVFV